jgi:uncharacterized linocin/CFP29 family protein
MPKEFPFFIEGQIVDVSIPYQLVLVRVSNGNIYHIHPNTPGVEFNKLRKGQIIRLEVTTMLTRVLSAEIIEQ